MSKADVRAFYWGYYTKLSELEIREQEKSLFIEKAAQSRSELGPDDFENGELKPEHKKDYDLGVWTANDDFTNDDYEGNEEDEIEDEELS